MVMKMGGFKPHFVCLPFEYSTHETQFERATLVDKFGRGGQLDDPVETVPHSGADQLFIRSSLRRTSSLLSWYDRIASSCRSSVPSMTSLYS